MKAEIVGVGTELLLGQIANTNAQKISVALAAAGIDVHYQTVVGDNLDRMVDTLRQAIGRSEVVIVTGGLGPTPDDITREGIAAACGVALHRDEALAEGIRSFFERVGRTMPEDNLRQVHADRLVLGTSGVRPNGQVMDTTVVEADIDHPTDADLLEKAVREGPQ